MSSFSPPSPRTCGGSQRWSPGHRHIRLSAWCRARVKASGSSAKEPASNGAAQSPNHQQAISATKSANGRHLRSLNHLINRSEETGRHSNAKGFGGLEVDDELEFRWLH